MSYSFELVSFYSQVQTPIVQAGFLSCHCIFLNKRAAKDAQTNSSYPIHATFFFFYNKQISLIRRHTKGGIPKQLTIIRSPPVYQQIIKSKICKRMIQTFAPTNNIINNRFQEDFKGKRSVIEDFIVPSLQRNPEESSDQLNPKDFFLLYERMVSQESMEENIDFFVDVSLPVKGSMDLKPQFVCILTGFEEGLLGFRVFHIHNAATWRDGQIGEPLLQNILWFCYKKLLHKYLRRYMQHFLGARNRKGKNTLLFHIVCFLSAHCSSKTDILNLTITSRFVLQQFDY